MHGRSLCWKKGHGLGLALGVMLFAAATHAAIYEVGSGQPLATPSAVPWESLNAGDTVRIHWRAAAYTDKWVICRQGTAAQPISVVGVPGPNGELPVIDGNGATTRTALNYWNGPRGVIKIGGANIPPDTTPACIVIDGLDVRSARPPYSFVDHTGTTQNYPNNAAAIYVEKGDHITIRNCVMHDCGNGLFVAAASTDVLVEANSIYDNGNAGSIYEHNSYTEAAGITFQFNHYGPLRAGCDGNNLKDRSAGTVIRYNWIESGNRQLDLVDAEDSVALQQDPRYRKTFVYGNILIEPDGAGNSQIVHYGGDSGSTDWYRKGTLYFYHNTVVSTRTGNTTLFRLSTSDESADCRNNILLVTAAGNHLAMLAESGSLFLTHNWLKPGRADSFAGSSYTGTITDDGSSVTGTDPGFLDLAAQNFHLKSDSVCVNAATGLHADATAFPVDQQYHRHQKGEPRRTIGVPDLGAYEYSAFTAWQQDQFGANAENDLVSGETADPDGDGLNNLVEYAFDLDPNVPSLAGLPGPVVLSANGLDRFAIQFHRRPVPCGLTYLTSVTDDFETWWPGCEYSDTGSILTTTYTSDASDANWTRVQLNDSIPALPLRFIAISVRRN